MRGVVVAVAMLGMAASAHAADMPDYLRGSMSGTSSTVNWRGFYAGGQGAWTSSQQTFSGETFNQGVLGNLVASNIISSISGMSQTVPVGTTWRGSVGYGAFAGYNWQWDEALVGLDASYLHGNFGGSLSKSNQFASASALSDGLFHDPKLTSTSSIGITDYATFRARAGYAWGCILPYAFGGLALGYANLSTTGRIDDSVSAAQGGPFTALPPLSATGTFNNHFVYGYTAGLGVDVNLIGGLFMRAEWEYVRFTTQVDMNVNSLRAGLGYKF